MPIGAYHWHPRVPPARIVLETMTRENAIGVVRSHADAPKWREYANDDGFTLEIRPEIYWMTFRSHIWPARVADVAWFDEKAAALICKGPPDAAGPDWVCRILAPSRITDERFGEQAKSRLLAGRVRPACQPESSP